MDESAYRQLADDTLRAIDDAFADVDPDLAESSISQGALTILFPGNLRCIVSPQPPVRQMWLAFRDRAWHFDRRGDSWIDDKGTGKDLYRLIEEITKQTVGLDVAIRGV
jgi:iron-sulfur cluster assembly protein CyaY